MTGRISGVISSAGAVEPGAEKGKKEIIVGLAEIRVAKGPTNFAFIGLGSGIGFCALDPVNDVAGAVHVMLPRSTKPVPAEQLGKFADTAIAELIRLMEEAGAKRENIAAAYAGGANVSAVEGAPSKFDIGSRNIEAIQDVIDSLKIPVKAKAEGGNAGRTLKVATETGDVVVKTIQLGEAVLCKLRP